MILETEADVRTWLPGVVDVDAEVTLPASMGSGAWEVSAGISGTPGIPMLRLANGGRDAEGWYRVSSITME